MRYLVDVINNGSVTVPNFSARLLALTSATRIVDVTDQGEIVDISGTDAGRLACVREFEYDAAALGATTGAGTTGERRTALHRRSRPLARR